MSGEDFSQRVERAFVELITERAEREGTRRVSLRQKFGRK